MNSTFIKKNPKYKPSFKNMPKLVRLVMGGQWPVFSKFKDRRCERRLLKKTKTFILAYQALPDLLVLVRGEVVRLHLPRHAMAVEMEPAYP